MFVTYLRLKMIKCCLFFLFSIECLDITGFLEVAFIFQTRFQVLVWLFCKFEGFDASKYNNDTK